jgi:hypothetical protein
MAKATNVTKHDAGGSGDNYIADGYIKSVEKIWADNYTIAFTNTNTTIDIAVLPVNKKIMGIDVIIETTASQTGGTISIGFNTDAAVDTLVGIGAIGHNATVTTVSLIGGIYGVGTATAATGFKLSGLQKVTSGTQTTVAIKLNNWTMTTGTIRSIVRYT